MRAKLRRLTKAQNRSEWLEASTTWKAKSKFIRRYFSLTITSLSISFSLRLMLPTTWSVSLTPLIEQLKMGSRLTLRRSKQGPARLEMTTVWGDSKQALVLSSPSWKREKDGTVVYQSMIQLLIQQQTAMRKKPAEYRPCSHIRSPLRNLPGPRPMLYISPLRIRPSDNPRSRSPSRLFPLRQVQTDRSSRHEYEAQTSAMEDTIKKGVGLFQQLANRIQCKQNQPSAYLNRPCDSTIKKSAGKPPSQAYGRFMRDIQEAQSIQATKLNSDRTDYVGQASFKNFSQLSNTIKLGKSRQNPVLHSFGESQYYCQEGAQREPQSGKNFKKKQLKDNQDRDECHESFGDIILLIKKASENRDGQVKARAKGEERKQMEESVKISFQDQNSSLTMSPFL